MTGLCHLFFHQHLQDTQVPLSPSIDLAVVGQGELVLDVFPDAEVGELSADEL